jgi:hypothetical protein
MSSSRRLTLPHGRLTLVLHGAPQLASTSRSPIPRLTFSKPQV